VPVRRARARGGPGPDAIGFEHPEHEGLAWQLGVELDRRANIRTRQTYRTSVAGVYACGDARIGQSLIVTAIAEGRKCARIVNKDLGGSPTDADREMLAIGAWSGEADRTLRHDAEAAGTVRPGEEFFSGRGPAGRFIRSQPASSAAKAMGSARRTGFFMNSLPRPAMGSIIRLIGRRQK